MEVKLNINNGTDYTVARQGQARAANSETVKPEQIATTANQLEPAAEKTGVDSTDLKSTAEEMTKWVQGINTNIKFAIHEETNELMVQVIDIAEQKVLREFPPRDFLDMVAKIREFVGMLLDKKA